MKQLSTIRTLARTAIACLALAAGQSPAQDQAAPEAPARSGPLRALILTGHNNHNWRYTSRLHADTLAATGRFEVTITDDPASTLASADAIKGVDVFVIDYNDLGNPKRWGAAAEKNFVDAVRAGKGVVALHSANNAFEGWSEYEQMLGLVWREGSGHGKIHTFQLEPFETEHAVMSGLLPGQPLKATDELYHRLANPQSITFTLLARAKSSTDSGGTGEDEPVISTTDFGDGRVFSTTLGHVWNGDKASKKSITNPLFKAVLVRGAEWAAIGRVTLPGEWNDTRTHNTLSPAEKAAGWELLFDGTTTPGWRGFKKDAFPAKGWAISNGTIHRPAGDGGGDIVTEKEFGDFELSLEWKASPDANSGIMYRAAEDKNFPWETGPECQVLDDEGHRDGKNPKTSAGSLYDLYAPAFDVVRPAGEWNRAVVRAKGNRLVHELNGFVVVDVELWSEEFNAVHQKSKWPGMPEWGKRAKGRIALQDHGDEVWFRNIKVRSLENAAAKPAAKADANWQKKFSDLNTRCEAPGAPVVFLGDSITEGWLNAGKALWQERFASRGAINLGIGGDRTQHVLYRLREGHLARLKAMGEKGPRAIVLLIGTNNSNGSDHSSEEIAEGITAIVRELRSGLPQSKVVLMSILPRGDRPSPQREKNARASELALTALKGDAMVVPLDLKSAFVTADGTLRSDLMPDKLHLSEGGYRAWADAVTPMLESAFTSAGK
ncbi:MAG: family 16 glycoside hydrolase [Planctomycetota bacterium]|nr:family 16 glycoside hydrolase [Planctomycetota bacterium]